MPYNRTHRRLSRSKLELFIRCPRCFYLDRRLGIPEPPMPPFTLNSAVDLLLKREFDLYRASHTPHPLMKAHGIAAVPFEHDCMDEWRDALRGGIRFLHKESNLEITGGVDDVWINPQGELHIVDYKATAKSAPITLAAEWQEAYKRQVEIYQWLFRQNQFKVNDRAYFVYANGDFSKDVFNQSLHFDLTILPYDGNDAWVEPTIQKAYSCLMSDTIPPAREACKLCAYREAAFSAQGRAKQSQLFD